MKAQDDQKKFLRLGKKEKKEANVSPIFKKGKKED